MTRLLLIVLALLLVAGCRPQPPAPAKPQVSAAHPIVRRVVGYIDGETMEGYVKEILE